MIHDVDGTHFSDHSYEHRCKTGTGTDSVRNTCITQNIMYVDIHDCRHLYALVEHKLINGSAG